MTKEEPKTRDRKMFSDLRSLCFLRRGFQSLLRKNLHGAIDRDADESLFFAFAITVQALIRFAAELFHISAGDVAVKHGHTLNPRLGSSWAGRSNFRAL